MNAITRRIGGLEDRYASAAGQPRNCLRVVALLGWTTMKVVTRRLERLEARAAAANKDRSFSARILLVHPEK